MSPRSCQLPGKPRYQTISENETVALDDLFLESFASSTPDLV
jgi:hypothetical protein